MKKKPIRLLLILCLFFCFIGFSACAFLSSENSSTSHRHNDLGNWGHNASGHWKTCSCGEGVYGDGTPLPHTFIEIWTFDEASHFKDCYCGYRSEETAHTFDEKGACTVCAMSLKDGSPFLKYTFYSHGEGIDENSKNQSAYYVCEGFDEQTKSEIKNFQASDGTPSHLDIVIPDIYRGYPVRKIASNAFANIENSALTVNITMGNVIDDIGANAFANCDILEKLSLGSGITSVDAVSLGKSYITVDENNPSYADQSGILYNKEKTAFVYIGKTDENVTIPEGITSIPEYAFSSNKTVKSVTLSNTVLTVEEGAFKKCSNLTNITLSNQLTYIGVDAFRECVKLENVTLPQSLTNIDVWAFWGCDSFTEIIIPSNVTTIARGINYDYYHPFSCKNLERIIVEEGSAHFVSKDGILYDAIQKAVVHVPKKVSGNVTVLDGVTVLGNLQDRDELISITIPDSVTSVSGFYSCDKLSNVTLGNGVTSIHEEAFAHCKHLTSITFGNKVTSIGDRAFANCESLKTITIPDSVTIIGKDVFDSSFHLESVTMPGIILGSAYFFTNTALKKITFTSGEIGGGLSDYSSLTTVVIGENVTYIASHAFAQCSNLVSVTFENVNGWDVAASHGLSFADLADPAKAAVYLRDTYSSSSWTRTNE